MSQRLQKTIRLLFGLVALLLTQYVSAQVVISQVYGGEGGSSGTYQYDYVELFNQGTTSVSLDGLTLQHGSSTGRMCTRRTGVVAF